MADEAKAMADSAANEVHEADKASVAVKADEAYNAEANEATKAIVADVAYEANETKKAGEAIFADEAFDAQANEVDEPTSGQGQQANKAGDAKVAKVDLPDKADKAEANDANKAKAYEVDEAIVANAANEANVINKIIAANIKHLSKLIEYSLTKCSVTFAKMKEHFEIMISNFLNLRSIKICS
jgi:hypothetical protein